MFRRMFRPAPLNNTGSLARDLLASERTFLAWTRTGFAFIALGVALVKVEAFATISPTLFRLRDGRNTLAASALVAGGSTCVIHGTWRYFRVWRDLEKGLFRPNAVGTAGLAAGVLAMSFAGTLLLLEHDGTRRAAAGDDARESAPAHGAKKA